jgi:hypothetical protein
VSVPRFDNAQFLESLGRLAASRDAGLDVMRPDFDARLRDEVQADAVGGRQIADYKAALGHHGFEYVPAHLLRWVDGVPKTEGEWRSQRLHMALTDSEVLFWPTPEKFWNWVEGTRRRRILAMRRSR